MIRSRVILAKPKYFNISITPVKYNHTSYNRVKLHAHHTYLQMLTHNVHVIGDGIIYFTMFYCGLNYLYYKQIRENEEDEENK